MHPYTVCNNPNCQHGRGRIRAYEWDAHPTKPRRAECRCGTPFVFPDLTRRGKGGKGGKGDKGGRGDNGSRDRSGSRGKGSNKSEERIKTLEATLSKLTKFLTQNSTLPKPELEVALTEIGVPTTTPTSNKALHDEASKAYFARQGELKSVRNNLRQQREKMCKQFNELDATASQISKLINEEMQASIAVQTAHGLLLEATKPETAAEAPAETTGLHETTTQLYNQLVDAGNQLNLPREFMEAFEQYHASTQPPIDSGNDSGGLGPSYQNHPQQPQRPQADAEGEERGDDYDDDDDDEVMANAPPDEWNQEFAELKRKAETELEEGVCDGDSYVEYIKHCKIIGRHSPY